MNLRSCTTIQETIGSSRYPAEEHAPDEMQITSYGIDDYMWQWSDVECSWALSV